MTGLIKMMAMKLQMTLMITERIVHLVVLQEEEKIKI
jgi:hypothetical protein